jgi:hypothetical protein
VQELRAAAAAEAGRLRTALGAALAERDQQAAELRELQASSAALVAELRGSLRSREAELDRARLGGGGLAWDL